jgi:sugar phosphate isomerase/epimerase
MFKQGVFVNILTPDSMQWKDTLRNLERFPSLDHVELWLEHIPKGNELGEIRSIFRNVEVIVHGPFIHTSLVSHIPEVVAITQRRFEEAVEFASKVQARLVTFHAGPYPLFENKDDVLEKLAHRFERFSEMTDPIATLENMPVKPYGTIREPIGKLCDYEPILELLPRTRFTLDIGHCLQNEDDFVPFIKRYSSRIENIHLHDGIPRGKGHLRLGEGHLDLGRFLDALLNVGFKGNVGMETISFDDTLSSWETLCKAEMLRGIRDCSHCPSRNS